jgi:hypothetical protein
MTDRWSAPFDGWSLCHLAVGYAFGRALLPPLLVLSGFTIFEIIEPSFKRWTRIGDTESFANQGADVLSGMTGFAIGRKMVAQ